MARSGSGRGQGPAGRTGRGGGSATRAASGRGARATGMAKSGSARIAAPSMTKDELRVRVEKLERANAMLRSKNKELKQALAEAQDRLDSLEAGQTTARPARPRGGRPATARPVGSTNDLDQEERRFRRRRREIDPGDGVPPGVAPEEPAPLTETDRQVLEQLEELSEIGEAEDAGPG